MTVPPSFHVEWIDAGLEPRQKPNPKFPDGIDVNLTRNGGRSCTVKLPYPAKRIGYYFVECQRCGTDALISTAGRPDDPRSVTLACKITD